jgi:hypothetical protein
MSDNKVFIVDGLHPYDMKASKINLNEKKVPILDDQVKLEMLSQGLNPLNKEDVLKFWSSKGVGLNG